MKALILAAGRGTRISRYLNGNPKCTVDLGFGRPLIVYTIKTLKKKGVDRIGIVTGYKHEVLRELFHEESIDFFYNPFFDVTNSIASTWFARDFLEGDDTLVMNGDVFCEEELYDFILSIDANQVMFYDSSRCEEADYRFNCADGKLLKHGKDLKVEETTGEYIGIVKMKKKFVERFVRELDKLILQQHHEMWWENVLYSMLHEQNINVCDVAPYFWAEVDYIEDYERIKQFVQQKSISH